MTFGERKKKLIDHLQVRYDAGEAKAITALVTEKISGKAKGQQPGIEHQLLTEVQQTLFNQYETELLKGRPVQYVLEEAWFLNRKFFVNEKVLIPRPETEELVMHTHEKLRPLTDAGKEIKILDIGTGSGCIAISLAALLPAASVSAMDVSRDALNIAEKNATASGVRINLICLDVLDEENFPELEAYDVIISNPPYIPLSEKEVLDAHVAEWEPHIALFTPDNDPLIFYKAIAKLCIGHLKPGGLAALEGHQAYMKDVFGIFNGSIFKDTTLVTDINDNERMVFATRSL